MKLIKTGKDLFKFVSAVATVEGSEAQMRQHLMEDVGIESEELYFAVEQMWVHHHDTAHFGVNRLFTHTSNQATERMIVAELQAIRDLRREFVDAYKRSPSSPEMHAIGERLMSLYMSLNVEGVLQVLNVKGESLAA